MVGGYLPGPPWVWLWVRFRSLSCWVGYSSKNKKKQQKKKAVNPPRGHLCLWPGRSGLCGLHMWGDGLSSYHPARGRVRRWGNKVFMSVWQQIVFYVLPPVGWRLQWNAFFPIPKPRKYSINCYKKKERKIIEFIDRTSIELITSHSLQSCVRVKKQISYHDFKISWF